jgi:pSer/pThr/pTyr-binding forkhead associated (FHA) protein
MTSFSNACGVKDSLRLAIEGPESTGPEPRRFAQPFVVLGRDRRADVRLDDPRVSRRHVYLQVVGGWAFWMDLESRTGTRTEAGPRRHGWLGERQFLGIGPFVVRCTGGYTPGEFPAETPLGAPGYGREPLPEVALEFLNGPSQSMFWPMRRVMSLIGSAKGCKFRLTDPSVLLFHASLVRTPAGLWVVDLRGGKSITVNAVPVRASVVVDGDILGIGRYRIRVRCRDRERGSARGTAEPGPGRASWAGRQPWPDPDRPANPPPLPDRAARALTSEPVPGGPPSPAAPLVPILAAGYGVEVVSSAGTALPLSPSGATESVLVPLVHQFNQMQQQMFDQFQQAMGMLVQMFGAMHREQMDVIREELDRLHQLTEELQALRSELANSARGPAGPGAGGAGAGPGRGAAPIANRAALPHSAPARRRERERGPAPEPGLPPAATAALAAAGPPPQSSSPPPRPRHDPPQGDLAAPGPAGPAPGETDAVLWIHQRIAALQQERETHWQKILKLLPGAS